MEMSVKHGIHELAPLAPVFRWNRPAADRAQEHDEIIIGSKAAKAIEELVGDPCLLLHRFRGAAHLFANRNCPGRISHGCDFFHADPADGRRRKLVWDMAIEGSAEVGKK